MSFSLSAFEFHLRAKTPIYLPPFSGSAFRGGFGMSFKKTVCIFRGGDCEECPHRRHCPYLYIFETPVDNLSGIRLTNGHAPHPFVLEPELKYPEEIEPETEFVFRLNLIGKGVDYLHFFIFTFVRLGEIGLGRGRGKFWVESVYSNLGPRMKIYSDNDGIVKKNYSVFRWEGPEKEPVYRGNGGYLIMNFDTPTRIQEKGKYLNHIPFATLVTNLLRRIRLLDSVHGDGEMEYDHRAWIDLAKEVEIEEDHLKWYDWSRYSHRQGGHVPMGGVVGRMVYRGPVESFLELLQVGSFLHVGKGTAFGLGKYRIIE